MSLNIIKCLLIFRFECHMPFFYALLSFSLLYSIMFCMLISWMTFWTKLVAIHNLKNEISAINQGFKLQLWSRFCCNLWCSGKFWTIVGDVGAIEVELRSQKLWKPWCCGQNHDQWPFFETLLIIFIVIKFSQNQCHNIVTAY